MKLLNITFFCIVFILVVFSLDNSEILSSENSFISTGKLKINEIDNYDNKKVKNYNYQLTYYLTEDNFRLNTTKNIYYIIKLTNEKVFLINLKRKSITATNLFSTLGFLIPPVSIMNNKSRIKNYLLQVKATRLSHNITSKGSFEEWKFKLKDETEYKLTFILPSYLIEKISIKTPRTSIKIGVMPDKTVKIQKINETTFNLPKDFKIVDLGVN